MIPACKMVFRMQERKEATEEHAFARLPGVGGSRFDVSFGGGNPC